MKICHMTSAHDPDDVRIFWKECSGLARAGYETYLVAQGDSREENGVHVIGVGPQPGSRWKRMLFFSGLVYRKARELDCDVYHFHDPELMPYGMKLLRKGKKVIFDSHEYAADSIDEKTYIPKIIRGVVKELYKRYERHCLKRLTAAISVTPQICDYLALYSPRVAQVTNYPIVQPVPETAEPRQNAVCFAGGIGDEISHDKMLLALKKLEGDTLYCVYGSGDADYIEWLKTAEGSEHLRLMGQIPHERVRSEMTKYFAGAVLCRYCANSGGKEGTLGNTKLFEYMTAGLPVICADYTLWQKIVDRWHCGIYVDPEDENQIAGAVRLLRDDPDRARAMGQNGRRAVEQEFNWSTQEKILLELYRELAG